ncbi:hypothetical protein PTSG_05297 [Salpingoeca rosetta]|uniref:TLC domain-containing protein n=1 Tax=Salpingoeca rosetta (strain ATCC 50818 / BSB-021) TaxID=946362 RepID=F2UA12_SALR5|nr:uncharacterized protein PTSG_05297 [Salpingoeca rosetta]EGD73587.1 hypothetical protein PTSG_05297 [Salpingoeca rosetta]|eukprot:XP_004993869.1 hypothetical protein PTSG_05297 [Salpingoeca rosetta]
MASMWVDRFSSLTPEEEWWVKVVPATTVAAYVFLAIAAEWLVPYVTAPKGSPEQRRWQLTERLGTLVHAIVATIIGYAIIIDANAEGDLLHGMWNRTRDWYQHLRFGNAKGQRGLVSLVKDQGLILLHHVLTVGLGFPLLITVNMGDYFFGHFFVCEASSIFMVLRGMLATANRKDTLAYTVNGLLFTAVFFWTRVLLIPRLMIEYATSLGQPWHTAPSLLRRTCWIGTVLFVVPQLYWFSLLMRGVLRHFGGAGSKDRKHKQQSADGKAVDTFNQSTAAAADGNKKHD